MKISRNWLKEYIYIDDEEENLNDLLTNLGLEVDDEFEFRSNQNTFNHVVTGQVVEVIKHPNADRLQLTKVNVGSEVLSIVCGAPNVAVGQKVVVAQIGAELHFSNGQSLKIKKGNIKGESSEGMLCAVDELGLGIDHSGILVLDNETEIGLPFAKLANTYVDRIFDIGLTPNRVDAASHIGVARDISALLSRDICKPQIKNIGSVQNEFELVIQIEDPAQCADFAMAYITGIEVKESPEWLKNKIQSIGLSPINNIVDIGNYIMFDLGQPLHAYDYQSINGYKIEVRNAKAKEKLVTLDKVEREMLGNELVIADSSKILGIAGVMGGLDSAIKSQTTSILIESAHFNPSKVRMSARKHGLHTDASFRFERGADFNGVEPALHKAIELINEIAGGRLSGYYQHQAALHDVQSIDFKWDYFTKLAGFAIPIERAKSILVRLGFEILESTETGVRINPPSYKPDVTRPVDVVEELLRVFGFNHIPLKSEVRMNLPAFSSLGKETIQSKLINLLVSNGYYQTKVAPLHSDILPNSILLANPLSIELQALRTSLILSGIPSIQYNLNRQQKAIKFFEFANDYEWIDGKYRETGKLVAWLAGLSSEKDWIRQETKFDFWSSKSIAETCLIHLGITNYSVQMVDRFPFEYAVQFSIGDTILGYCGALDKEHLRKSKVEESVFALEFLTNSLLKSYASKSVHFQPFSKFPTITRDLSFIIDSKLQFDKIYQGIMSLKIKFLKNVTCFDVYKGKNLGEDKISYALRFVFESSEKTLKDSQIDFYMKEITNNLEAMGCLIRK